jgi:branched-chain amino acid transport system ATP-binding protein
MTVLENLITAIEGRYSLWKTWLPWGALPRAIREESYALLKEVGLEGKALERAASLSGGQMRLLEIVRALGFGAELFLLDEPTAGVSPSMKDEVARVIEKLRETKKTILVIEHDIQFIQRFCERIIVLDSGSVVMDGAPQEVRESERLQQIYFGSHAPSA